MPGAMRIKYKLLWTHATTLSQLKKTPGQTNEEWWALNVSYATYNQYVYDELERALRVEVEELIA